MIPDGSYDVMVIDAESDGGGDDPDRSIALELAIASGARRGEMVTVTAHDLGRDPLDLLGVPATLTVIDGVPRVDLEG